jgi:hypothetical protein
VNHQETLLLIAPWANARAINLWAVVVFVPGDGLYSEPLANGFGIFEPQSTTRLEGTMATYSISACGDFDEWAS